MLERRFVVPGLNVRLTLGPLRRGRADPSLQLGLAGAWRATRSPDGPVTTHLSVAEGMVRMRAWGPGASWALEAAPDLVGAGDDRAGFVAHHPVVHDLDRRLAGLRIPRSRAVVDAAVASVIEQKVTGLEAKRSYRAMVRALGDVAPGPGAAQGLIVPPPRERIAATPYWVFHRFGLERRRADAVRRVAAEGKRLEEAAERSAEEARRRLRAIPGVGAWTVAEVARVALGDADAVSVGDYHLCHHVAWALAGEPRADDARMLELLEPYRGHRGRVTRLIEAGSPPPPRRGPRMPARSIARL